MFPGRKKRIMTFFNSRFGKDPADSAEALQRPSSADPHFERYFFRLMSRSIIASIPGGEGRATHWHCSGHSASRMRSYGMQMKRYVLCKPVLPRSVKGRGCRF